MKSRLVFMLSLSLMYQVAQASREERVMYIERYKSIAIQEMNRTGIPASVKMAQAILESRAGTSVLAKTSNNHFGIKCGSNWDGKTVYRKDDDYHRGKLIQSCFRAYNTPEESFMAHSDFLVSQPRYSFLFKLKSGDYKGWAYGLKKAGYASDPSYPQRLIDIIETFNLQALDRVLRTEDPEQWLMLADEISLESFATGRYINDAKVYYTSLDERVSDVSESTGISINRILKYNEGITNSDQKLSPNTIVYLQPKRKSYRGKKKYHVVQEGETMLEISQRYGVKLDALYERNHMQKNTEPAKGAKIFLRNKPDKQYQPKLRSMVELIPVQQELPNTNPKPEGLNWEAPAEPELVPTIETHPERQLSEQQEVVHYTVKSGDTLYGLSRRFGVSIDRIKEMNKLDGTQIHIGQVLQVKL